LDIYYKNASPELPVLKLKVENGTYSDETFITLAPDATNGFDKSSDAFKLFSFNPLIPQLYSINADLFPLAIHSLPENEGQREIMIGFKAGSDGSFTLSADGLSGFGNRTRISLKDLKTGTTQNLNSDPVYSFSSTISDDANRFLILLFSVSGLEGLTGNQLLNVRSSDGTISISYDGTFYEGMICLYDLCGKLLCQNRMTDGQSITLPVRCNRGVYLIQIVVDGKVISKKVTVY
jgi:hypothetical protein